MACEDTARMKTPDFINTMRGSRKAQMFVFSVIIVLFAYVLALNYKEVSIFDDFVNYMSTAAMFYFGGQSAIDFMRAYKGEPTKSEAQK